MSVKKKLKVVYFGEQIEAFLTHLPEQFDPIILPANYDMDQDQESAVHLWLKNKTLNPKYRKAIFIFSKEATILTQKEALLTLPSYRLMYSHQTELLSSISYILAAKGAYAFDFNDAVTMIEFMEKQYAEIVYGRKLEMDYIKVASRFQGKVIKKGHTQLALSGHFGDEFTQLLSWRMTDLIEAKQWLEAYLEIQHDQVETDFLLKVYFIRKNSVMFEKEFVFTADDLATQKVARFYNEADEEMYLNFALFAKGQGTIKVAHLHVRNTFADQSYMIPGGKSIQDKQNLGMEIGYYFEPADFKPPLAVYFSGYRTAEGFEGKNMMEAFGSPYLLISDPRIEGGNFYLGSDELEQQLIDIIQKKLNYLGFSAQDLVLSGLSMGTFGALYYASDLLPKAVIVGKPMMSLGTVALNERIKRSDTFATSLDTLLMNTGDVTVEKALAFDAKLFEKFQAGDYQHTMFVFAYMKQDDYDDKIFAQVYTFLKQKFPLSKVLHKGLVGRHNDNTQGIVRWFVKQYYNILETQFHREYTNKGGD